MAAKLEQCLFCDIAFQVYSDYLTNLLSFSFSHFSHTFIMSILPRSQSSYHLWESRTERLLPASTRTQNVKYKKLYKIWVAWSQNSCFLSPFFVNVDIPPTLTAFWGFLQLRLSLQWMHGRVLCFTSSQTQANVPPKKNDCYSAWLRLMLIVLFYFSNFLFLQ